MRYNDYNTPDAESTDAMTRPGLPAKPYRRIVIVGASGAGKSTLAEELAGVLGLPCFELDSYAGSANPHEELHEAVQHIAGLENWIVPADYTSIRSVLWPRAQAILWLDYPLVFSMVRLARRELTAGIIQKALTKQSYSSFWSKGVTKLLAFRRSFNKHRWNRRMLRNLLRQREFAHIVLFRFKNPAQASLWVNGLSITHRVENRGAGTEGS